MSELSSVPKKRWRLKRQRSEKNGKQRTESIVSFLMRDRGLVEPDDIRAFLYPDYLLDTHDPFLYRHMQTAVDRINQAIQLQQPIVIFGDYDADGVTSSTVMYKTLQRLGANILRVYIPHREKEGYGLNIPAVQQFIDQGAQLLITLDCGTTNVAEVDLANTAGVDVIVVDHHHVPEAVVQCFALLNAKAPGERYPFEHLAGVGATFKLAQALLASARAEQPSEAVELLTFEKWLLDLVAIATVTDLVPLVDENRTLLKYGLMVLNRTRRPGLKALIERAGVVGEVTADTIAFQIGPRLNAPGRMAHAELAFRLLSTDDEDEAKQLADELEQLNRARQKLTETMARDAESALLDKNSAVAVSVGIGWPAGLVGLVASRITEKLHRPCLVVTVNDEGVVGSGRSIPTFNIIEALHSMPEGVFVKFGGHAQACGFTLTNKDAAQILQLQLHDMVIKSNSPEDLLPLIEIETDMLLHEASDALYEAVQLLEPFGMSNRRPLFMLTGVHMAAATAVGTGQKHLRVTFTDEGGTVRHGIGFGLAHKLEEVMMGDKVDVVAELTMNEWNGARNLQLRVHDLRKAI